MNDNQYTPELKEIALNEVRIYNIIGTDSSGSSATHSHHNMGLNGAIGENPIYPD